MLNLLRKEIHACMNFRSFIISFNEDMGIRLSVGQ